MFAPEAGGREAEGKTSFGLQWLIRSSATPWKQGNLSLVLKVLSGNKSKHREEQLVIAGTRWNERESQQQSDSGKQVSICHHSQG